MKEVNAEVLKDAQYRKGLSIAFFNATNAAIELTKVCLSIADQKNKTKVKKFIKDTREWFLEEHKTYYGTVIANVGANYDVKTTIGRLESATDMDSLKNIFLSLSEDERRDGEVIKKVAELKKKYEIT
jgi:hypothetical protein